MNAFAEDQEAGLRPGLAELVALRKLVAAWPPLRRAASGAAPMAHSTLRGRGMEYAESRPYLPGDDARHIDWRVTARTGVTHSKLFHPERERTTLLVCDPSPALFFGTRVRLKSVQAARAAALAAWGARRGGDRLGALHGGGSGAMVPPAGGERGVLQVLHALCRWYQAEPAAASVDSALVPTLEAAARLLKPGSRLVVVADASSLLSLPEGLPGRLAQHNDVLCVLLTDPIELAPPTHPVPLLVDGQRTLVDFGERGLRDAWVRRHRGRLDRVAGELGRRGIATVELSTNEPTDRILPWLLSSRPEAA